MGGDRSENTLKCSSGTDDKQRAASGSARGQMGWKKKPRFPRKTLEAKGEVESEKLGQWLRQEPKEGSPQKID